MSHAASSPSTTTATCTTGTAATRRRVRGLRRRGEPGMAMLLVLMLIVLVSAAGVFAAQSAALDVRSSGFFRQAAQTHYVAEAGAVATLDELRRNCLQYKQLMDARALTATLVGSEAEVRHQYAFYLDDFTRLTTAPLFATPTAGTAGSLGPGALSPGFVTTATLLYEVPTTLVGQDVNSRWPTYVFELASSGTTRLPVSDTRGNAVGNEETRVLAQVPCF